MSGGNASIRTTRSFQQKSYEQEPVHDDNKGGDTKRNGVRSMRLRPVFNHETNDSEVSAHEWISCESRGYSCGYDAVLNFNGGSDESLHGY